MSEMQENSKTTGVDFTDEQQAAITAIDCNVAVSAGAGSGKTKVLVARFMYILEQSLAQKKPLEAANILAITFTRKAAGEMKTRIRQSISEKIATDVLNAQFWRLQLQNLERAQITTIHGLCSRILRENPVEAKLDPGFTLAEEFAGRQFVEDCVAKYLRRGLAKGNEALRRLVGIYGASGFMSQVSSLLPQLPDITGKIITQENGQLVEKEQDLAQPYREFLAACAGAKQSLQFAVAELVEQRENLVKPKTQARTKLNKLAEALPQVLQELAAEPISFATFDAITEKKISGGSVKELWDEIKSLRAQVEQEGLTRTAIPLVEDWQLVLGELYAYIQQEKAKQELLTFDDLELQALELLKSNAAVRKKYHEHFRYIMVDEFQDTNERQRQLIYLLCGDSMTQLEGRKLFIVGDAKQSIYRFRGAEVKVFADVQREIDQKGGRLLKLTKNFRSIKSVLTTCNSVFKELLGEDKNRDVYFEALDFNKDEVIEPVLLEVGYTEAKKAQRRRMEAEAVAQKMLALHDGQGVAFGQMTVLLEAMTDCPLLVAALDNKNVPYVVVDGKGFYERQEVLDLLHLLTVLHNHYRSLELAGVLRSPYFGLDDATLTQLFLSDAKSLWQALMDADVVRFGMEQGACVARARGILLKLRSYAALYALPELLGELWRLLNVEAVLSVQEHGESKLANACKLRDEAIEYCNGRQASLGDWLAYVDAVRESGTRATTANLDKEEAVQIMTIHNSKGLEFKTVFLPQLDRKGQNDMSSIKYNRQLGLGIKAPQADGALENTPVLDAIKKVDKEREREEYIRKLYVAMTRAEARLIMSGAVAVEEKTDDDGASCYCIKQPKTERDLGEKRWLQQLMDIFAKLGTGATIELVEPQVEQKEKTECSVEAFAVTDEILQGIAPRPAFCSNGRSSFTASALQTYLYCPRQYYYQQVAELPPLEATNCVGGTCDTLPAYVTGLIVHRALELYRGDAQAALAKAVSEQGVDAAPVAKFLLEQYLASGLYKELPAEHRREQHFVLPAEGLMLEGVIDYLAETSDGLILVDYKTGTPPASGEADAGYAYQLAIYKKAAERMFNKPVLKAELHFLQNNSRWELPADKEYFAEAMELCHKLAAACEEQEFPCEAGRRCAYCPYAYICPQENQK